MPKQMSLIGTPDPEWIALLRTEVDEKGTHESRGRPRDRNAALLAVPASVRQLSGPDGPQNPALCSQGSGALRSPRSLPASALRHLDETCKAHATAPMSTSDPLKLRQWAACRACPPIRHSRTAR